MSYKDFLDKDMNYIGKKEEPQKEIKKKKKAKINTDLYTAHEGGLHIAKGVETPSTVKDKIAFYQRARQLTDYINNNSDTLSSAETNKLQYDFYNSERLAKEQKELEGAKTIYDKVLTKTSHILNSVVQKPQNFYDGWQFGDVTKTAGSSALGAVEKVLMGVYSLGNFGKTAVADIGIEYAQSKGDKNLENRWKKALEDANKEEQEVKEKIYGFGNVGRNSIFGSGGATAFEGVGQSLALGGAGKVGGGILTFAQGYSAGIDEANKLDSVENWQKYSKAIASGGISWLTENITELAGYGAGVDDIVVNEIQKQVKSGIGKAVVKATSKGVGEGLEEIIESTGNTLFNYALNRVSEQIGSNAVFDEKLDIEGMVEDAVTAFISAGFTEGASIYTQVEQNSKKVIKQIEETTGTKLTLEEKRQIKNEQLYNIMTQQENEIIIDNSSLTEKQKENLKQFSSDNLLSNKQVKQAIEMATRHNEQLTSQEYDFNNNIEVDVDNLNETNKREDSLKSQINSILEGETTITDLINNNENITDEQKQELLDLTKNGNNNLIDVLNQMYDYENTNNIPSNNTTMQNETVSDNTQQTISSENANNIKPLEKQRTNKINNAVNEYIKKMNGKFETKINLNTSVINDTSLPVDLSENNKNIQGTLNGIAKNLFNKLNRKVFKNNNEDIYVSNRDIRKSISETLKNQDQKKYYRENISVFSQLDKIIENAQEIAFDPTDKKGRTYKDYKYYVSNAYIDGNPYIVEFDTRIEKGSAGQDERHFRLERVYPLKNKNEVSTDPVLDNSNSLVLSENTSNNILPQNDNSVKVDITNENSQNEGSFSLEENEFSDNEDISDEKVAEILSKPYSKKEAKTRLRAIAMREVVDKGYIYENLDLQAKDTKNRTLQSKYHNMLHSYAQAQYTIAKGHNDYGDRGIYEIRADIPEADQQEFNEYAYHYLNIDRMSLESKAKQKLEALNKQLGKANNKLKESYDIDRAKQKELIKSLKREIKYLENVKNKPVFGDSITAEMSEKRVKELEQAHPEFKKYLDEVYKYLDGNVKYMVDHGVISQETAEYFKELYPHYVPIDRVDDLGRAINVPLDTNKTGINNPIHKATGGSSNIQPLFETIANRTKQTYMASNRNDLGNALYERLSELTTLESNEDLETELENLIDSEGTFGTVENVLDRQKDSLPTFTIFQNGKKVTFQINNDIYNSLREMPNLYKEINNSKGGEVLQTLSSWRRNIITEYNPFFMLTNAIKDGQDVLMNSQHPAQTYAKFPEAYAQIKNNGKWYQEYMANGGFADTFFKNNEFKDTKGDEWFGKKALNAIANANNFIELAPRLAEYIASREAGASVETAMLDSARVTTNFSAGGDTVKLLNKNGFTFLNANIQGLAQQVRNVREANAKGLKGWTNLAIKSIIAGLPAILLNNLIWKDDDEYEDLADYVKDNYYVICKIPKELRGFFGGNNFFRIPKGRTVSAIQKIISNAGEYITNDKKISIDNILDDLIKDGAFAWESVGVADPRKK